MSGAGSLNALNPREAPQTTPWLEVECKRLDIVVYLDVFGDFRCEFRQADGHYVDSKESYEAREDCLRAAIGAASTWMRLHSTSEILQTGAAVVAEQSRSAAVEPQERARDRATHLPDGNLAGLA